MLGHVARPTYDGSRIAAIGDDAEPAMLTFMYDSCLSQRLCSITDKADSPRVTTFRYSPDGLLAEVVDADGHVTHYDYRADGKLQSIRDALGRRAITLDYNGDRVSSETFASGSVNRFEYHVDTSGNGQSTIALASAAYAPQFAPTFTDT